MKADKNFDFYEFAGIVMPGAVLISDSRKPKH